MHGQDDTGLKGNAGERRKDPRVRRLELLGTGESSLAACLLREATEKLPEWLASSTAGDCAVDLALGGEGRCLGHKQSLAIPFSQTASHCHARDLFSPGSCTIASSRSTSRIKREEGQCSSEVGGRSDYSGSKTVSVAGQVLEAHEAAVLKLQKSIVTLLRDSEGQEGYFLPLYCNCKLQCILYFILLKYSLYKESFVWQLPPLGSCSFPF